MAIVSVFRKIGVPLMILTLFNCVRILNYSFNFPFAGNSDSSHDSCMSIEEEGSCKGDVIGFACVIADHTPSPYDRDALTLKVCPANNAFYIRINISNVHISLIIDKDVTNIVTSCFN